MFGRSVNSPAALNVYDLRTAEQPFVQPDKWSRLSYEVSGCVRSLNTSMFGKLANIRRAKQLGWNVDVYCVLEACGPHEDARTEADSVATFVREVAEELHNDTDAVVNCTYWPHGSAHSLVDGRGRLSAIHRAAYPSYPYKRRGPDAVITHALSAFHKLRALSAMRRHAGRPYSLVWRNRPDFVSTGLEPPSRTRHRPTWPDGGAYLVPKYCIGPMLSSDTVGLTGSHTDIEAILTVPAAERYASLIEHIETMYTAGWPFAPEQLLDEHMRSGGFRYAVAQHSALYRCSEFCFGSQAPCRLVPFFRGRTCQLNTSQLRALNFEQLYLPAKLRQVQAEIAHRFSSPGWTPALPPP